MLEGQAKSRVPELVPIRYGRMLVSPFTFYRGAAAVMAMDLAETPQSGLRVQACGDAHLSNFGIFAAPDRRLVFGRQRLRRDAARAVGVGRQAPGRQLRGRRARPRLHAQADARRGPARRCGPTARRCGNSPRWATSRLVRPPGRRSVCSARWRKVGSSAELKAVRKNVAKAGKKNSLKAFERSPGRRRRAADRQRPAAPGSGRASWSPEHQLDELEGRISELLAGYRESLQAIVSTSSTGTGSSIWPARWSGSAASGRAAGWC